MSTRITVEVAERIEALAHRHRVEPAEIIRRFISAGLEANPAPTADEVAGARAKKAGHIPGLVIPLSPVARAEAQTTGEAMEENPLAPSGGLVRLRPTASVRSVRRAS